MRLFLLILFALFFRPSYAQFYDNGQSPSSIKWDKIESPNFTLIYPEEIPDVAKRFLILLEKNYFLQSREFSHKPGRIPVILHNQTVRSNGFVTWAPKRMEIFTHPDVRSNSQEWLELLAIHEFRHVLQVDLLNSGISKVLTTILGEQGIGPAAGMSPLWLLEGDAVFTETKYSESGRGRLPSFEMGIKANLLENDRFFSYTKAYLGSYRHFVPNYYEYGYQLVSYGIEQYGENFWRNAFETIGRKPWQIDPLGFYLKKHTGAMKQSLYRETMESLKIHWSNTLEKRGFAEKAPVNFPAVKGFTSYNHPQVYQDSMIIAVKSGLSIIDRIVLIESSGKEKILAIPGFMNSGRIDLHDDKIIWDEVMPDIRWANKSSSVLKEYNISTGQSRILHWQKRYSSPAWSGSGDTLVAVETTLDNRFNLIFISALDGGVLFRAPSPENVQLLDPEWVEGTDRIVSVGLGGRGKSLLIYDRSKESWDELLWLGPFEITQPVSVGNFIVFNATYEGVDDIYAYDLRSAEIKKLSHSKYGAFEPGINEQGNILAWAEYSQYGYNIVKDTLDLESLKPYRKTGGLNEQPFFRYGDGAPQTPEKLNYHPELKIEPKNYAGIKNLFHIHSWAPWYLDYFDPELAEPGVNPGISLLSQNLLSTAFSQLGYEYDQGDHLFHAGFTYRGWWPVLDFRYDYGGSPVINAFAEETPAEVSPNSSFSVGSWIPFNLTSSRWITGFQPSIRLSYNSEYFFSPSENRYKRGMTYLTTSGYFYSYQKTALRDLQPRWGLIMDLRARMTPFEDEQFGNIQSLRTIFYVPGLIRNHGLRILLETQKQNPVRYYFNNQINFPRGYDPLIADRLTRYSFDYVFPLLHPDLRIDPIFYLKRIRAAFFSDYIKGEDFNVLLSENQRLSSAGFHSLGAEFYFDYHLFRLLFPISTGIRFSYLYSSGNYSIEPLFNIYLNPF